MDQRRANVCSRYNERIKATLNLAPDRVSYAYIVWRYIHHYCLAIYIHYIVWLFTYTYCLARGYARKHQRLRRKPLGEKHFEQATKGVWRKKKKNLKQANKQSRQQVHTTHTAPTPRAEGSRQQRVELARVAPDWLRNCRPTEDTCMHHQSVGLSRCIFGKRSPDDNVSSGQGHDCTAVRAVWPLTR